jgi:hypothetical protein
MDGFVVVNKRLMSYKALERIECKVGINSEPWIELGLGVFRMYSSQESNTGNQKQ